MSLKKLATLWPPKKDCGKLVLAGDSADKTRTFMVFKNRSRDGKYVFYSLCEKTDDDAGQGDTDSFDGGEGDNELPF